MKLSLIFVLVLVACCGFAPQVDCFQDFDRGLFYRIMEGGNTTEIDQELDRLDATGITEKRAYEGALLMRKSGQITVAAQRLKLFKEGRIRLETAIAADTARTEYYFLRLMIEEHAPKIVKYQHDLVADKARVVRGFPQLSPALRQAIRHYSQQSSVLHPQDF